MRHVPEPYWQQAIAELEQQVIHATQQEAQELSRKLQWISQIDFDLLRREFSRAEKKNLLLRDLQELEDINLDFAF